MGRILVGVDGSAAARGALAWAVGHADEDDTVEICNVWSMPAVIGYDVPAFDMGTIEQASERLVEDLAAFTATELLADDDEGPTLETSVAYGHPGSVLIDKSDGADLVVVGSRGYGGFKGLLLGSVSTYVVHHARCPVAVIPVPEDH